MRISDKKNILYDPNRIALLEREWEELENTYRLEHYNAPFNREEEYQNVLDAYQHGRIYNPQFLYLEPPTFPIPRIRDFMAKLQPGAYPLEMFYYEKARNELLAIQAVQTHAPEIITASSMLAHGLPDKSLLAEARRILEDVEPTPFSEPENLSAEDVVVHMQRVIDEAGIQDWKVIVFEPMHASMSVNRLDKELKIRKGAMHSSVDVQRLIVHEIGTHIVRYENGAKQPVRLFKNCFPAYTATEEGLAVYNEERAGLLQRSTLRKYAGRVIAANLSLSRSFSDIFHVLAPQLGAEMTFEIAARTKRGFLDTSEPGADVKDVIYLKGFLAVQSHLTQHPEDYPLLFAGKFGLQHLPFVHALLEEGVISPPTLYSSETTKFLLDGRNARFSLLKAS